MAHAQISSNQIIAEMGELWNILRNSNSDKDEYPLAV